MKDFALAATAIDATALRSALGSDRAGAVVCFEGVVRDHSEGRAVRRLAYQAYAPLAEAEGARIVAAARARHAIERIVCVHRVGELAIGEIAVFVGVSAAHRDAAFAACREVIDEVKRSVPIWKKEHYADGESAWLHPDGTPVTNRAISPLESRATSRAQSPGAWGLWVSDPFECGARAIDQCGAMQRRSQIGESRRSRAASGGCGCMHPLWMRPMTLS